MRWVVLLGLAACGSVKGSPDARPADAMPDAVVTQTMYTLDATWSCADSVDCEDVYDFDLPASASVTAKVTAVTGASVPRLGLFKGTGTTGNNVFTNAATDLCGTQDTELDAGPATVAAGHIRVAVGRDWGASAGSAGTYTITIMSAPGFVPRGPTADDQPSNQAACP